MNAPLTEHEKIIAEENLSLVYKYLKMNGLDEEEFFDVVIFGFLESVKQYIEREELQKYSLSTIAFKQMDNCMWSYWRGKNRKKREHEKKTVSIDKSYMEDGDKELHEMIADTGDFTEEIIANELLKKVCKSISESDSRILLLLIENNSISDIARLQNTSRQAVHQKVRRIRKIVSQVYEINL